MCADDLDRNPPLILWYLCTSSVHMLIKSDLSKSRDVYGKTPVVPKKLLHKSQGMHVRGISISIQHKMQVYNQGNEPIRGQKRESEQNGARTCHA